MLVALVLCPFAKAHHGFANHFDPQQEHTIEGTVSRFDFVNPHVKIVLNVQLASGESESWMVETSGVSVFLRNGRMSRETIKIGDHLRVVGHPARERIHEMRANIITLPTGDELQLSNPYQPPAFLHEFENSD